MKHLIVLLALVFAFAACRTGKLPITDQNADLLYEKHHYFDAAVMYNKLVKKQKNDALRREQTIKLANCYRQMNRYDMAAIWYEKVITQNPDKPEYLYVYADLLMSSNNY